MALLSFEEFHKYSPFWTKNIFLDPIPVYTLTVEFDILYGEYFRYIEGNISDKNRTSIPMFFERISFFSTNEKSDEKGVIQSRRVQQKYF